MPRNSNRYNNQAAKAEIEPILLVRLLNIPHRTAGTTESLYLTDYGENIQAYDETGANLATYYACPLKFSNCEVTSENPVSQGTLALANVSREFSVIAGTYDLVGVEVHVLRAFPETLAYPDGLGLVMIGHADSPVITEDAIQLTVACDFSLNKRVPRFMYSTNLFPYIPAAKDVRSTFTG